MTTETLSYHQMNTEADHRKLRDRNLLILLWGIILAKCFAVEYLVEVYAVPINSVLYIWSLTLLLAVVATVVYLTLMREESLWQKPPAAQIALGSATAITTLLIIVCGLTLESFNGYLIPPLLSVTLGLSYFIFSINTGHRPLFMVAAFGWWISAALQFLNADVGTLLLFSASLMLFTVLPVALLMFRNRARPGQTRA